MNESPTKPQAAARFSLLNLVLLTTIVALGFGLLASARRNAQLDDRNRELAAQNKGFRNALGIFEVEDPAKIHAIRVPAEDNEPRKYRVYLPAGRRYTQYYKTSGIPEEGVPEGANARPLEPGHYLFTIAIERERYQAYQAADGPRHVVIKLRCEPKGDFNSGSHTTVSARNWITHEKTVSARDWTVDEKTGQIAHTVQGPGKGIELHDPDEPLVIYRSRAQGIQVLSTDAEGNPTSSESFPIPGEADGFMLWIESEPLDQQD